MKSTFVAALFFMSGVVLGQTCTDRLSLAEQDYRNGRLEEVGEHLCRCIGAYQAADADTGLIAPSQMRHIIEQMIIADQFYPAQLGNYHKFWKRLLMKQKDYRDSVKHMFSFEERYRALVLLGKIYNQLNVLPVAEIFAVEAISMFPQKMILDETEPFRKLYNNQKGRVREYTIAPIVGWAYAVPIYSRNYSRLETDYQWQSGKLVLGLQFNYSISPAFMANMNFWFHSTSVVYQTKPLISGPSQEFNFYHSENIEWIKFPMMLKWSAPNHLNIFRKYESLKAKIYFAGGISPNFLVRSKATIINVAQRTSSDQEVTNERNRFNLDLVVQGLIRFKIAQDYINIGGTGTCALMYLLRDPNAPRLTGAISENDYRLLGGFWTVTYERRFSRIRKNWSD
jgi:hypothetical protein